jgi:hypothetical protein
MEAFVSLLLFLAGCAIIAVSVWAIFLLGAYLSQPWYVSAVAILLMGRLAILFIDDWRGV